MVLNIKDFPEIEKKIAGAETPEELHQYLQTYTGPGVGTMYDEDTKKIVIADGWAPDVDGNVLNILENTGPATGKVLKDGVITPV